MKKYFNKFKIKSNSIIYILYYNKKRKRYVIK